MSPKFKSPPTKDAVRCLWCTEILRALKDAVGARFFYLGLPGPEAKDVAEWHKEKLLGRVCAFQMLDLDSEDQLGSLTELEAFLSTTLGPAGIPYDTYLGLLEDVLTCGRDANGKPFVQDDLITLYQLDFCHAFTDRSWNTVTVNLRYQAIRELMVRQFNQNVEKKGKPFVVFLTVRDEIDTAALAAFIKEKGEGRDDVLARMVKDVPIDLQRRKQSKHPGLKAFVFDMLNTCFRGLNIRGLFLPPVYYTGVDRVRDPMVVFTVLAAFDSLQAPNPVGGQTLQEFLKMEGLRLEGKALTRANRCAIETTRVWTAQGAVKTYLPRFLDDPVWLRIKDEAKAGRIEAV